MSAAQRWLVTDVATYDVGRELLRYDGALIAGVVRDQAGPHLALMTDSDDGVESFVLAALTEPQAVLLGADPLTSTVLRQLIATSTRVARVLVTYDEVGGVSAREHVVTFADLAEDELPAP